MKDFLLVGTVVGVVLYVGKALMIRLILGRRFHQWITSTPLGLGIMDLLLSILGAKALSAVNAEGVLALIILVAFGACTTLYISITLLKRNFGRWVNALF